MYEFEDDGVDVTYRKYYSIEGTMVAKREWVNQGGATTSYFASDPLSSTSIVMDSSGSLLSENRYMPFGEKRNISGTTSITETDFTYTGQRDYSGDFGLMDYDARFYSPSLGRFTQPDSVVPEPGNSQAWNRYSYTMNSPILYIDPTGHFPNIPHQGDNEDNEDSAENDLEGEGDNGEGGGAQGSGKQKDVTYEEILKIIKEWYPCIWAASFFTGIYPSKPIIIHMPGSDSYYVIMPPYTNSAVGSQDEGIASGASVLGYMLDTNETLLTGVAPALAKGGIDAGIDVAEALTNVLPPIAVGLAVIDLGVSIVGCNAEGECYNGSPGFGLPEMTVVNQDVYVTTIDLVLGTGTMPAGGDVLTSAASAFYDVLDNGGNIPNYLSFGVDWNNGTSYMLIYP